MSRYFFVNVVGVLLGLATLGAGCASSETGVGVLPPVPSNASSSRLYVLQGVLPEFATTTVSFSVYGGLIHGRYSSVAEQGQIYGAVTTSTGTWDLVFDTERTGATSLALQPVTSTETNASFTLRGRTVSERVIFRPVLSGGSAQIELHHIEQNWTMPNQDTIGCHVDVEYPVVVPNTVVSVAVAEDINRKIRAFFGETATSTIEDRITVAQQECVNEQRAMPLTSDQGNDMSAAREYENETSVSVARNERGLVSFVYSTYFYTGGAHPNTVLASQTFDLVTGEELLLSDLVRTEALTAWIQREQAALLKTAQGEWLFDAERSKQVAEGKLKGDAASSTAAYQSREQWYVDGNTLVRFYQSYEIAPYAAGLPSVDLPFATWQDLARSGAKRWF